MLYPPSIVPKSFTACLLSIKGELASPFAIAERNAAFTYAASSTPAGTLFSMRSSIKSSSPAGGSFNISTRLDTCCAESGFGTMPELERSAT